ncbi:MAG: TraB/GumN family protein [Rubrivivax sp.]|nr:MAG: TraB/GumN family protein [Rubrivivax sp.]
MSLSERPTRLARRLVVSVLMSACCAMASWAAEPEVCPPTVSMPTAPQLQAAMAAARDHGLLWRIRKDGHDSYLYGTIHVGKLDWAFPGPQVGAALKATDTLALELDPTDPAVRQTLIAEGGAVALTVPPGLNSRLERQRALACLDSSLIEGAHPVMKAMTLAVLAGRADGLDPAWGQEIVLAGFAKAAKRAVVALETPESQLKALIPDDPQDALALIDDTLRQLEQKSLPATLRRLADTWALGQLDELAHYERWCDCMDAPSERRLMKRLLDDRNPHLAEGIDALHRRGQRVFAAVGALHMTGEQGLPSLLERLGYTVVRIDFNKN